MIREVDAGYINDVLDTLASNPTSQHLDELIEYFTTVSYWSAIVTGDAEMAKSEREFAEASIILKSKTADPKLPGVQLEAMATVGSMAERRAEIKAFANAKKLSNLVDALRETINAVKFLGRNDGMNLGT